MGTALKLQYTEIEQCELRSEKFPIYAKFVQQFFLKILRNSLVKANIVSGWAAKIM